jgi:hypothetical protein
MLCCFVQGGLTVHPTDRIKMDVFPDKAVLHCKKAEKGDAGKYLLTLHNDKGMDTTTVGVVIYG